MGEAGRAGFQARPRELTVHPLVGGVRVGIQWGFVVQVKSWMSFCRAVWTLRTAPHVRLPAGA